MKSKQPSALPAPDHLAKCVCGGVRQLVFDDQDWWLSCVACGRADPATRDEAIRILAVTGPNDPRSTQTHVLKCWPEPFDAIRRGLKKYEIRRADRGYQVGDFLELREFSLGSLYTGSRETVGHRSHDLRR